MVQIARDSDESMILNWLRFILAVLVVFIHSDYKHDYDDLSFYIGSFITEGIAQIAVPTFFFISGYLFFSKYESYNVTSYLKMIASKGRSLVFPYILWNIIGFISFVIVKRINILDYDIDLYKIFWNSHGYFAQSALGYDFSILNFPDGNSVLWFIRDLIVVMLLSPIIWILTRIFKLWSIIIFLLVYLLYLGIPIPGFGLCAICFFSLGATFSICGINFVQKSIKYRKYLIGLFCIVYSYKYFNIINGIVYSRLVDQLFVLLGVGIAFVMGYYALRYSKSFNSICKLGETSFVIYVAHTLQLFVPIFFIARWINVIPLFGTVLGYIFSAVSRILICVVIYYLLKQYFPRFLSILVGGRLQSTLGAVSIRRFSITKMFS